MLSITWYYFFQQFVNPCNFCRSLIAFFCNFTLAEILFTDKQNGFAFAGITNQAELMP
jgi:cytidine deaminase